MEGQYLLTVLVSFVSLCKSMAELWMLSFRKTDCGDDECCSAKGVELVVCC